MLLLCRHCGSPIVGRRRAFCDAVHRKRAQRRRDAGLDEAAHNGPRGGRRGQVRLGDVTRAELDVRRALWMWRKA